MAAPTHGPLGLGDRALDFELPAADAEGTVSLGEQYRRGPVLLTMLRGLYCPFCRRQISQLRPMCETLRAAGIPLLGIVIASPERARQYFRRFPPCFPIAAAPDRAIHRAYGLPEVIRTPEFRQQVERMKTDPAWPVVDGFEVTAEDEAEWQRPLQSVAYFLIGRDGLIRWALVDSRIVPLPPVEELLSLV
jgi:peroxiredoxin